MKLTSQHQCQVLHYEGYGKDLMKKFKMSPDAWVQLVKQLAFHKMFGRPGVTYESAQTRKFQLGRTEVIRSASNESKAWAEAMLDPAQTVSVASISNADLSLRVTNLSVYYQSRSYPIFCFSLGCRTLSDPLPRCCCSSPPVRCLGCRWARRRSTPVWLEEAAEGGRASARDLQG